MATARFRQLAARLELRGVLAGARVAVDDGEVVVTYDAPERDTGAPGSRESRTRLPMEWMTWSAGASEVDVVRFLRRCLLDALEHELDEALHVDGVRVFDPHARGADLDEALRLDGLRPPTLCGARGRRLAGDDLSGLLRGMTERRPGAGAERRTDEMAKDTKTANGTAAAAAKTDPGAAALPRVDPQHLEALRGALQAERDTAVALQALQPVAQVVQAAKTAHDNARFRLEVTKREIAQAYGAGDVDLATGIVRPVPGGMPAPAVAK